MHLGVSADFARMILRNVKVENLYNDPKDDVALCSWMLRMWRSYGIINVLLTTEYTGVFLLNPFFQGTPHGIIIKGGD